MTRPPAHALTAEIASVWLARRVPWRVPGGLVVGWVAALVISVATDNRRCSTADLTICGPDQVLAVAIIFLLATPVLLFWMPLVGCLTGIVFALADVLFDDLGPARISWAVYGVACAAAGAWLIRSRRRQRAVADMPSRTAAPPTVHTERWGLRTVVAGLLVLLGTAMLARYAYRVAGEQDHLNRAEATVATVVAVDDENYTITIATRSGQRHTIEVLDHYPVDSRHTVFTDPADPSWIRLDTEPDDATLWETGGLLCFALAGLLWWRAVSARRARTRLLTEPQPALAVRLDTDENGNVVILAADDRLGQRPLAILSGAETVSLDQSSEQSPGSQDEDRFGGQPDWDEVAAFGRWWRDEEADTADDKSWAPTEPVQATLLGRFAFGGWVAAVTDELVLLPNAPLRPARKPFRPPWRHDEPDGLADRYGGPPGRLVSAASLPAVPEPPMKVRQPGRVRLVGAIGALAGFAAVPTAVLLGLPSGWYQYGTTAWIGGWLAVGGLCRTSRRLLLGRRDLTVVGALTVLRVPWERVLGIRIHQDRIALGVEPDEVLTFGPVAGRNGAGPAERAEQVAAAMCWLRERALAAGRTGADRHVTPNPVALVGLVCYGLLLAAALWWRSRYG